jgi:transcription elongation factor GreB
VRNYVTPRGFALLRAELAELTAELAAADATAAAGSAPVIRQRIAELEVRLGSAELVEPASEPADVVRFGARVTLRTTDGTERTFRIVGVDEANAAEGRVAFVAPLARALLGKRLGESAIVKTPRGDDEIEVAALDFAADVAPATRAGTKSR